MVKGGRKPNHGRGGKFGTMEDFTERNGPEVPEDPSVAKAKALAEEAEEEEQSAKPKRNPVLEKDDDLEAELAAQFGETGLTRKQREELEEQERKRKEERAIKAGETEQAKADMERLAEIRRKREEASKAKAEQEAKAAAEKSAKEAVKADESEKHRKVAEQVFKLVKEAKDGKMTLNTLNQDAGCKKVLKPLCKSENVKSINKAWLEKFPDLLEIKEEGKDLVIYAKAKVA